MTASHNTMNQLTTLGGGGKTIVAGSLDDHRSPGGLGGDWADAQPEGRDERERASQPGQVSVGIAGQGDKPARMLSGNRFETEVTLPSGTSTLDVTAADAQGNTTHKQYTVATAPQTARTMTYDADGNLTGDGVRTYEWDAWSRLTKITWATGNTTDISYNALGQRSKLVHTDGATTRTEYYLYDGAEVLQRRTNGTAASYADRVYFAQGERRKTGSTWASDYYTRDHLGSVREVLASNGTLLARYDYMPYGERETRYEASGYTGTDFGFTGHFTLDSPVAGQQDLVLAHFRAYDPLIGRWLSQDPIREAGGVNLYGYVGNMPANRLDPDGLDPITTSVGYFFLTEDGRNTMGEFLTNKFGAYGTGSYVDGFARASAAMMDGIIPGVDPMRELGEYNPCEGGMDMSYKAGEYGRDALLLFWGAGATKESGELTGQALANAGRLRKLQNWFHSNVFRWGTSAKYGSGATRTEIGLHLHIGPGSLTRHHLPFQIKQWGHHAAGKLTQAGNKLKKMCGL